MLSGFISFNALHTTYIYISMVFRANTNHSIEWVNVHMHLTNAMEMSVFEFNSKCLSKWRKYTSRLFHKVVLIGTANVLTTKSY